ncbi:hypothetical protein B9J94_03900 [Vibrio sp. V20_P4S3T152]|nr:hypothetical protein B9J89_05625 [Vibrio sp. V15_P4S5T153]OXX70270.1 hypothetical protein B9J94_03900 [Vibrio sp. V20_P4S3T152]
MQNQQQRKRPFSDRQTFYVTRFSELNINKQISQKDISIKATGNRRNSTQTRSKTQLRQPKKLKNDQSQVVQESISTKPTCRKHETNSQ